MPPEVSTPAGAEGRVAFARIEYMAAREPLPFEGMLQAAIVPGTHVERHRRRWTMGPTVPVDDRFIGGRIGFQAAGAPQQIWDDKTQNFIDIPSVAGRTSPFAIDQQTHRIAFQLRASLIRKMSFVGAMQALLREASGTPYRLVPDFREMPFGDWAESVDRVSSLHFKLLRPNPHYGDRDFVEQLIEGPQAAEATVNLMAAPDVGLDILNDVVRQSVEHAEAYGDYNAVGTRTVEGDHAVVRWSKGAGGESAEVPVAVNPESGEVTVEDLVFRLREAE